MKQRGLQVAVVGAGYWGPNVVRSLFGLPDCNVRWVCDKSAGRRQFIAQRFPDISLTSELRDVVGDDEVDGVFIATPLSTHYPIALECLHAGKHVFVEKPFTATSSEASRLVDLAERRGLRLGVGHVFVHHPAFSLMKDMAMMNRIGRLCYAESARGNPGPPDSEADVIWDLAIHDIAVLLYLVGSMPVQVEAHSDRCVHPKLADVAFIRLQFRNGFFSQHHVSWLSGDKVRRFDLFGDSGCLLFDHARGSKVRNVSHGIDTRLNLGKEDSRALEYRPGSTVDHELPQIEPLAAECRDFLDSIRNGSVPKADGRSGMAAIRLMECITESAAAGGKPTPTDWVATAASN